MVLVDFSCTRNLGEIIEAPYLEAILNTWYLCGDGVHAAKMAEFSLLL
jgi:hypothetical protein